MSCHKPNKARDAGQVGAKSDVSHFKLAHEPLIREQPLLGDVRSGTIKVSEDPVSAMAQVRITDDPPTSRF